MSSSAAVNCGMMENCFKSNYSIAIYNSRITLLPLNLRKGADS